MKPNIGRFQCPFWWHFRHPWAALQYGEQKPPNEGLGIFDFREWLYIRSPSSQESEDAKSIYPLPRFVKPRSSCICRDNDRKGRINFKAFLLYSFAFNLITFPEDLLWHDCEV